MKVMSMKQSRTMTVCLSVTTILITDWVMLSGNRFISGYFREACKKLSTIYIGVYQQITYSAYYKS